MTDSADTAALLNRIREGDSSAVGILMSRHRDLLRQFIEMRIEPMLRKRVDPSDIVQEAQIEMIRRLDDFLQREPMPFQIWLRKTAYQNLLRLQRLHLQTGRRTVRREVNLPESVSRVLIHHIVRNTSQPLDELVQQELTQRVRRSLETLPDLDREVLLLRAYEGLDNRSVATLLELDPRTVSKRYARALLKLRRALLSDGPLDNS